MSISMRDGPSWLLTLLRLFRQEQGGGAPLTNIRAGVLFCTRLMRRS